MWMIDQSGVLIRELCARIINISESGCLIETRRRLEVGAVGTLELQFGTGEFRDHFEVMRCEAVERGRPHYHVGVRFLWTTPRHAESIRYAIARHCAELEPQDALSVM